RTILDPLEVCGRQLAALVLRSGFEECRGPQQASNDVAAWIEHVRTPSADFRRVSGSPTPSGERLEEVLRPFDARLDLLQLPRLWRDPGGCWRLDARLAAIAQRQEPRELPRGRVRVDFP